MPKKLFVIYDPRAETKPTNDCTVMCCAESLYEIKKDRLELFPHYPVFSYDVVDGNKLINERRVL